jgi:hypothetical protein
MGKTIRRRDGKFAGSIGNGRTNVPTTQVKTPGFFERRMMKKTSRAMADAICQYMIDNTRGVKLVGDATQMLICAQYCKAAWVAPDWIAVAKEMRLDPYRMTFDEMPEAVKRSVTTAVLLRYYKRAGTPWVSGG